MPPNPEDRYRQNFAISTGLDKLGIFKEVERCLQETSNAHSIKMGISIYALQAAGLTWVLARQQTLLYRLPAPGEEIEIETWPSALSRIQCRRDFSIRNQAGEIIGHTLTNWVVVNLDTRKAERVPEFISSKYLREESLAMPELPLKPSPLDKSKTSKIFLARPEDIDINDHITSARYVDFMLESVPEVTAKSCRPVFFDIIYRAEALEGDLIDSRTDEAGLAEISALSNDLAGVISSAKCRGFWHNLVRKKKTFLFIPREAEKELVRGFSLWVEE